MSRHVLDPSLTTEEELLHLMEIGDIWIERSSNNSFLYAVERQEGKILPINQQLAKVVIHNPRVTQQRWYEGWGLPAKATNITRWIIEGVLE